MAVRHGYGKIAGTDALVFAYDTGDTRNSYKGEPTTNVALTDMTAFTKDNGCTVTATGEFFQGQPVYRVYFPAGTLPRIRFNFAYTTGQTWNGSIYYKVVQSGDYMPQFFFREAGFGSGYTNTTLNNTEWTRANLNYTFNSNGTSMFLLYRSVGTSTLPVYIDFAMPQLELKSHATQYTAGTRSATQGLLDLTGNNTINITNLSFDSTAHPTWDGTNDSLAIGTIVGASALSQITIETVVRSTANNKNIVYSQGNGIILHYGGAGFYLVASDNTASGYLGWNSEITGGTGVYEHLVATWDGNTMKLYVNGTKTTYDRSFTGGTTGVLKAITGVYTGLYFNATQPYFQGDMDIFKIYNRALTTDEVRNNYRHYKTRFNIS